jgi:hypothetical protein
MWSAPSSDTKLLGWRAAAKMSAACPTDTVLSIGECSTSNARFIVFTRSVITWSRRSSTNCWRMVNSRPASCTWATPVAAISSSDERKMSVT